MDITEFVKARLAEDEAAAQAAEAENPSPWRSHGIWSDHPDYRAEWKP